jgi:hypothetical protein
MKHIADGHKHTSHNYLMTNCKMVRKCSLECEHNEQSQYDQNYRLNCLKHLYIAILLAWLA